MKEKIRNWFKEQSKQSKIILVIVFILVIFLVWIMMTLEYIAGEVSLRTVLAFLFGIFIGILLTLFEESWRKSEKTIRKAQIEAEENEKKSNKN